MDAKKRKCPECGGTLTHKMDCTRRQGWTR